jgi:hypothetical protein
MEPTKKPPRTVSLEDIMRPAVSVTPDIPAQVVLTVLSEQHRNTPVLSEWCQEPLYDL